jgi:hypothetical protein
MRRRTAIAVILTLALTPGVAWANAGWPMFFVTIPALIVGLIPVVLMEGLVAKRKLGVPYRQGLVLMGKANLVSTLLAAPVASLLNLVIALGVALLGRGFMPPEPSPDLRSLLKALGTATFYFEPTRTWDAGYEPGDMVWEPGWYGIAMLLFAILYFFLASALLEYAALRWLLRGEERPPIGALALQANALSYAVPAALVLLPSLAALWTG